MKRSHQVKPGLLFQESKSMSNPLPGMFNRPNEDDPSASHVMPTVHPITMTGDGNSALCDLAYLVQASIPPAIMPFQSAMINDGPQHDEYNNSNSNAGFFHGQYSSQDSFFPTPDSPFVGASEYGHTSPFAASSVYHGQYHQNRSNRSDPPDQYQPDIDYRQIHHQPQMHTHHGHGSDNGNTSNNPPFYPS